MSIDLKSIPPIAGENARTIRDILRRSRGSFRRDWLQRTLGFSERKAQRIVEVLERDGYVERDQLREKEDHRPIPWYHLTRKGEELMRASAARRIKRSTAQGALDEFMKRVHLVNSDARYLCFINKVAVYGSFLEGCDRLGDVDVAVDLQYRIPLKGKWWQIFQKHASNSGRHFPSFEEEIDWPRREVILALKARKRSMSIQSWFCFIEMEKPPSFQYKVLLGNVEEVRRDLERAERESSEDAIKKWGREMVPARTN
jgi:DNA-binding MarR family transcriptional regulator